MTTWPRDGAHEEASGGHDAPHFVSVERRDDHGGPAVGAEVVAEVLALWLRVNDAGGAVGFSSGAPRDEVAHRLGEHLALVDGGQAVLGLLRSPDGQLLGCGLWQREGWTGFAHRIRLWRLMVDPAVQGRGMGGVLLSGMHELARRWAPTARLWCADYRSGQGLGRFYEQWGWHEVGRVPFGIELPGGERGDEVHLVRRPDGGLPAPDGRP